MRLFCTGLLIVTGVLAAILFATVPRTSSIPFPASPPYPPLFPSPVNPPVSPPTPLAPPRMPPPLPPPGPQIYSALNLSTHGDLVDIVRYVTADLAQWYGPSLALMDTLLLYRSTTHPANIALADLLPTRLSWAAASLRNGEFESSSISGVGDENTVQIIMYDAIDPWHRIGVVVHETYHILQIQRCPYSKVTDEMRWMREGTAAALEQIYARFLSNVSTVYHGDDVYPFNDYVVRDMVQTTHTRAMDTSDNLLASDVGCVNYGCYVTAVLYLTSLFSPVLVFDTYLREHDCSQLLVPFGRDSVTFEGELRAWLLGTDYDVNVLLSQVDRAAATLFDPNAKLCADYCDTLDGTASRSPNYVCDADCGPLGADCTDCGPAERPTLHLKVQS